MADQVIFVQEVDGHGPLQAGNRAVNGDLVPFALQGDTTGVLAHYATLAAAIAAGTLVTGQYVIIQGGNDGVVTAPNADKGIWYVASNDGAARSDFVFAEDVPDKAEDIHFNDATGLVTATDAKAAILELADRQVYYPKFATSLTNKAASGATSTAWSAAIKALTLDKNGSISDLLGAGNSTTNGVIVSATMDYQIPVRSFSTRDVIDDGAGNEVYAKLSFSGGEYVISFFSWVAGVETAFTMPAGNYDIGFVMVSIDNHRAPPDTAVMANGAFWGDQAGVVGNLDESQVQVGPFTSLLAGASTLEQVNQIVDRLGSTANGDGASLIGLETIAGMAATNVQSAIAELYTALTTGTIRNFATIGDAIGASPLATGTFVIIGGAGSDATERGIYKVSGDGSAIGQYVSVLDMVHTAAELLVADAGDLFTGTDVETALTEIMGAIGGASSTVRDFSSNNYVADGDSLVVAVGKLDAAVAALLTDRLSSKAFTANVAIAAAANGPRLAAQDGAAWKLNLANAGTVGPRVNVVGFVTGADYAANSAIVSGQGVVTDGLCNDFTGLTPGAVYYADPAVPGGITSTVPSVVGQWIIEVGIAVSATVLLVRIGSPTEIVAAQPALQAAIHRKDSSGGATGIGAAGYTVAKGDLWIDDDTTVKNPVMQQLGRQTVFVCLQAWTGTGAALTSANVNNYFKAVGKQG